MFSVLNAVLLRPLPYRSPEQLAMLWTEDPTQNLREGRSALWDVEQWRTQSQSFADMATFDAVTTTLTGAEGTEQIVGASISSNLLSLLGVQPVRGRSFSSEDTEEQKRLVLISHRFWQARFAGSNDAIGATLVLNGPAGRDHQRRAGSALVAGARPCRQKVQVGPTGFRRTVVHRGGRGRQHAAAGAGA